MSAQPGHFHARQILLAERAKRTRNPTITTAPCEHPSFATITTIAPHPLERTPSLQSTVHSTPQLFQRPNGIVDILARVVVYPVFLSCCMLVWLRYEWPEFQWSVCYKAGHKWIHRSEQEKKRAFTVWLLMVPVLLIRLTLRLLFYPVVFMVKDNDKKRKLYGQGGGLKKPCQYTSYLVDSIHMFTFFLYTLVGIHLTLMRLLVHRFEDTEKLWCNLRIAWWASVTILVSERNVVFVGQCLLTPE